MKRTAQELKLERISPFFVLKSDEGQGTVDAIVSVFGVVDDGRERIVAGAFKKTIVEFGHRVKVLDQHQTDSTSRILGRPIDMREVGRSELPPIVLERFPAATGGLMTTTQYNMQTQSGRETFHRIVAGDITEYSIGFNSLQDRFVEEVIDGRKTRVREHLQIKLWEFSPVIWGMNAATATVGYKGQNMPKAKEEEVIAKEVGEDGHPIRRFGDQLHAAILRSFMAYLTYLYEDGWMSAEEFSATVAVGNDTLMSLRSAIDTDVAERELSPSCYSMFAGDNPSEVKASLTEQEVQPTAEPESVETEKPLTDRWAELFEKAAKLEF